jgi:serine protease Do
VQRVKGDVISLIDGRSITATILKETSEKLWLDMGFTVIEVPRAQVESIARAKPDDARVETRRDDLFRTATNLPERTPKELARKFGEAVIMVSTPGGLGSGFIIHPDGYAITNAHVIQGETRIKATVFEQRNLDFRRREIQDVEIVAVNNHMDLALIKLKKDEGDFPTVYLADTDDLLAGQEVFAIGAPLGLERTLSQGVIATTQRNFEGSTFIQTTAQINPGNSGGPLFNTRGEVIGVTNMKIPFGEGLGFAIPAKYVRDFVRNRDAFAYDRSNPNSGYDYLAPPPRTRFGPPGVLDDSSGAASDKR